MLACTTQKKQQDTCNIGTLWIDLLKPSSKINAVCAHNYSIFIKQNMHEIFDVDLYWVFYYECVSQISKSTLPHIGLPLNKCSLGMRWLIYHLINHCMDQCLKLDQN